MKRLLGLSILLAFSQASFGVIHVGSSLTDLASIASYVGGEKLECFAIARSASDPHSVEVLPTYMVKASRADLYLKVGLGLDQWADQIIEGARNSKLSILDCSTGIEVLEKPEGRVDASMGDVHPGGNPHYWLSPRNGNIIAQAISEALSRLSPDDAEFFRTNSERFRAEAEERLAAWRKTAENMPRHNVVTYHSSWSYFAKEFGLNIVGKIEPVPGIPPTGRHLAGLVEKILTEQVCVVIQEPYFSDDGANYLARETGVVVAKLTPSCPDASADSYFEHFDVLLNVLGTVH
ncbi:zinc ABC transporter substrate-binding protein [bacterium]|nr:zinc ABC transporter substrate-binding protein [bacterium]